MSVTVKRAKDGDKRSKEGSGRRRRGFGSAACWGFELLSLSVRGVQNLGGACYWLEDVP